MTNAAREQVLKDLVARRGPVPETLARLKEFPWDSGAPLVILTRRDILALLDEYLREKVARESCEEWANALELRDDIGMEHGFEDMLKDFIFELANPTIKGPLTRSRAESWKASLGG